MHLVTSYEKARLDRMPERGNGVTTRDGQNVTIVHDKLRHEILRGRIPAGETSQAALARDLDLLP